MSNVVKLFPNQPHSLEEVLEELEKDEEFMKAFNPGGVYHKESLEDKKQRGRQHQAITNRSKFKVVWNWITSP